MAWRDRASGLIGVGALVALIGCAEAPPPPPDPTVAQITITAASDANPDPAGRASPTVVFLYALQPGAPFGTADPDILLGGEAAALQPAITRVGRVVMVPGREFKQIFTLPDGTAEVGIAAGYRAFDTAAWRTKTAVQPNQVTLVKVGLGANAVAVQ